MDKNTTAFKHGGQEITHTSAHELVADAGPLPSTADLTEVGEWLNRVAAAASTAPASVTRPLVREYALAAVRKVDAVSAPAQLVDAVLPRSAPAKEAETPPLIPEKEPWPSPVKGEDVLSEVSKWLSTYLWLPDGAADAVTGWIAATWFVDELDWAPLLAILSATKRCGKTRLLSLIQELVRKPYRTSGAGITEAALFRLNEKERPTFLIDEAERLQSVASGRGLISLLNDGTVPDGKVLRCHEVNGGYDIHPFDAYGFRAVGAIGGLQDALFDRSIVVQMRRKPESVEVKRLSRRTRMAEGHVLARKLRRWSDDHAGLLAKEFEWVDHPDWLNDRAFDNWIALFGVANLVKGSWPDRMMEASRLLSVGVDKMDPAERLLHNIHEVFLSSGVPVGIASAELIGTLNKREDAPWGDQRSGKGLSAIGLANLLKPFGIGPEQRYDPTSGDKYRGYWWDQLTPVFRQYGLPCPDSFIPGEPGEPGEAERRSVSFDEDSASPVDRSTSKLRDNGRIEAKRDQRDADSTPLVLEAAAEAFEFMPVDELTVEQITSAVDVFTGTEGASPDRTRAALQDAGVQLAEGDRLTRGTLDRALQQYGNSVGG